MTIWRMKKISLLIFLGLLFGMTCEIHAYAAENSAELLVVIDGSYSIKEEKDDIQKLLNILYQWVENEAHFQNVQYVIFRDEAIKVDYEEVANMKPKGYTCISEGLKLADEIVEEAVNEGRKLDVLVISDMLASVREGYTWEEAEQEQQDVNDYFEKWDTYCKNGSISYLVLTWKDYQCQSLSQIKSKNKMYKSLSIKEFCCEVPGRTCWIQQTGGDAQDPALSQTQLVGNTIKNILESLSGVQMKNPDYVFASMDKQLQLPEFCEAYVVTTENNALYLIDNESKKEIETFQPIDGIRIYYLNMDFAQSTYCVLPETQDFDCYLFYVPKPQTITTCSTKRPIAGTEFQVKCKITEKDLCELLPKPLYVTIYREENGVREVIKEAEMEEKKELFLASLCLEESEYCFQIRTNDGQVLDEISKTVYGGNAPTPIPTPPPVLPDIFPNGLWVVFGCSVVVLIVLTVFVVYMVKKRRK